MILARRVPCAMLFLRTPGGLSHHPDETVLVEDVETALTAALEFLTRLRDDKAMLDQLVLNARSYAQSRLSEAAHA
jgi:allantoate deiminase